MHWYQYPTSLRRHRKHGPYGYLQYEQYRDWLRDEFSFRCAYCLHREKWGSPLPDFHIDHYAPVSKSPQLRLTYSNLLYVCGACNKAKGDRLIESPEKIALGFHLKVNGNGTVTPLSDTGKRLDKVLRLNHPNRIAYREQLNHTLNVAKKIDPALFEKWLKYPVNLPDLKKKKPAGNTRVAGLDESFFVLRSKGLLPAFY